MRSHLNYLTLFVVLFNLGCSTSSSTDNVEEEVAPNSFLSLDSLLNNLVESQLLPGIQIAVFDDQQVLFEQAVGYKDFSNKTAIDPLTTFEAASLSKTVTAHIALQAEAENKLSLDSPLYEIVPLVELPDERAKLITARQILAHKSGLPNWRYRVNLEATSYEELFPADRQLSLKFDPGERFGYSGEGYIYLQRVLEKIYDKPFAQLIEENIFQVVNMTASNFVFGENIRANYALGHDSLTVKEKSEPKYPLAAASLHSNANDYARFLIHSLGQVKYPNMFKPTTPVDEDVDARLEAVNWGLGLGIIRYQNKPYYVHWGDNGSFKAYYMYGPTEKLGFVYFSNSNEGLAHCPKIIEAIYGEAIPMYPDNYAN